METNTDTDMKIVCKYNQQGFCKYRQQCSKQHVNKICPSHPSCLTEGSEMRHPRKFRTFHQLGKCKFTECEYFHSPDENIAKIDKLEMEVGKKKL